MRKLFTTLAVLFAATFFVSSTYAEDVIKIGVQAPITGSYANEGQGIDKAVRLLVEQKNAEGGLLGKKIEVYTCDDEGTAQAAAICGRELVNKGVIAVIGSYTSTCAQAAQKIYYNAGVLQTSDGTADALTENSYWTFFRNSNPNSAEAVYTADWMVNKKKYDRIAVITDYSTFAQGLGNAVVEETKKLGGNIIYTGKIKANSQNYTPILTKIKSLNPDVIYFSGYYSDGGLLRAQQKQLGINADFIGGDANDNPDFVKLAGSAAEGAYIINVPTPELLPYDVAKKFLASYKEKYNEMPPSIWTVLNADGLRAIMHAIEETKSLDTKTIANYLVEMEPYPGLSGPLAWDEDGERVGSSYLTYRINENGNYDVVSK
ncbi:MAG: branched-chain amino acid ABC transporter substrate-binding protein [Flexistipes sinusarabici]|uniref:Branched-chain amino acid ABC transporter substrate-binding protein n=1 Tax=Flexistipes sinusarabici TaxID=2352 RepID=A0A5D0MNU9_FLESI|nr:branched-chain amino acid ABC transporter substrate-binding protein [Flexistipes sinusarabici]TYB34082.1 MAG: branched-chain amino acid ABC transporter substrate-binding protein [Flexistipes sinusarabici]